MSTNLQSTISITMAPKITIQLNPPLNNDFYSTNDRISGKVKVELNKSLSIKRINVILKGFTETLTKIDYVNTYGQNGLVPAQDNRSIHTLFNYAERVFPPDNVWDALEGSPKPFKVKPGQYEYSFGFEKLPKRPKCLTNHYKGLICFTEREETRMPPSHNNQWRDLAKIDDLELFHYAYGKVLYMVQVQIELGKSDSWYKPFNKIIREIDPIEFIPDARELEYEDDEENDDSPRSRPSSSNRSRAERNGSTDDFDMNPRRMDVHATSPELHGSDRTIVYPSRMRLELPDQKSTMWMEVRSRGLRRTYRRDYLFCTGCNKFDKVYFVMTGNITRFRKWKVVPAKVQLNLLETATYLSKGVANENFSSMRLIDVNNIPSKLVPSLIDFDSAEVSYNKNDNKEGRLECEIKLRNHPLLKNLKFNEEDYRHRGNRLCSFKTCTIKRVFNFQLLIDWDINGTNRQTEVIINPMQIFVQTNPCNKNDVLPRYVEPPLYTEAK